MAENLALAGCGCDIERTHKRLLPVSEAVSLAHELVQPLAGTELVTLAGAVGRVLARDLHAPRPMPFFDNSAMDGYAVRTRDFSGNGPWCLPVAGPFAAGDVTPPSIPQGPVTVRIFTGAPVPEGFDAVVMQEYVEANDAMACFTLEPRPGQNVRRSGEDLKRGTVLVKAGTRVEPRHVGLLAANGYAAINVIRRPRIGIFSTGDELAESGCELSSAQLFDANRPLLLGLAEAAGAQVEDLGIVGDDLSATTRFFRQRLGRYDMLISSGAASVGGKDFVKQAFESAGGKMDFWKVAMKPGKPVIFGHGNGTVFAGLPGNSFAAFVGFKLFLEGMIERLQGRTPVPFANSTGIADFHWTRSTGRTEYVAVSICDGDGQAMCRLSRLGHGGSASLYPVAQADGVAVVSAALETVKPGDELPLHRFV